MVKYTFALIIFSSFSSFMLNNKAIILIDFVNVFTINDFFKGYWQYLVMIIFLGIIIFLITQKYRKDKEILEEKVRLRTFEIMQQNEEIKSQRDEIKKQRDFANIQHDQIYEQKKELEQHKITLEQKILERTKDLIEAKKKAEESDRLKTSFLANLSHEVRTPLNAIIGFAKLLVSQEITNDERKEYIELINDSSDQLLQLINDIIDISKIESKQLKITKNEISVCNFLDDLYKKYNLLKDKKGKENIKLIVNKPVIKQEDFIITSDKKRLKQIFGHLIENAIKYTLNGKIEFGYLLYDKITDKFYETNILTKKTVESVLTSTNILFYVKDTGIGISPDKFNVIFDRFRKIEDDNTRLYRGTGVGLSISKGLVNLLDGEIGVESVVNKGSCFYFTLPFNNLKNKVLQKNENIKIKNKTWQNLTFLVVEDEESNYRYLEALLLKRKAKIIWAQNGQEAIDICKENKNINFVLLDIKMPGMNGKEVAEELKKINSELPIVAQTAFALNEDRTEILEAGCDDYMAKPIKPNIFYAIIEKWLYLN